MDPMDTGVKKWNRYQNCPSQKDSKTSTFCVKCKNYICRKHSYIMSIIWTTLKISENGAS
ncbi:hypothetical protein EXN66_Car000003 [Channa argus]|uniref:Uncharacterized protein n=1 Tax=Channa argus TaxID=215402 RepID=A0A6G1QX03_CHAAH|nr:hypothetical protein EXN66_Car000003 [Channa argus]